LSSKTGIPSERRRVGILGAGAMGVQHLEAWHKLGVPIGGLYARNVERGRAAAEPYGCPVYDSVDALVSEVEIADICLPTTLHQSTVRQAAEAGCQIVCEKPLALDYGEGEAIFRDCDQAKVRIFLAMVVRFFPAYRAAWERVSSGALGQVEQIALKRVVSPPPPDGSWFLDDRLSGGVLCDLLIHDIDYAMWVAGKVTKVDARREGQGRSQYGYINLEHAGGASSRIEGGWVESGGLQTTIDIVGSREKLQIAPDRPLPFVDLPEEDPYVEQLRHFQDSLANDRPFLVTRDEVLRVMRVVSAAGESAKSGRSIVVAPE
jgi:myo-inositol 2-dehydrogenase/D-chiro-inositol 1-dehydrogenase